uniref:Uncharacterized protein n=1 Tax=Anguilla anguilla TaxID=7936 RepID=A0A0E9SUX7_ANGAN
MPQLPVFLISIFNFTSVICNNSLASCQRQKLKI